MKKNLTLIVLCLIALVLASPAHAQMTLTSTTLSAAVTTSSTRVVVVASAAAATSSATGFAVGNQIFVDFELMDITAINSTTLTVRRGAAGTVASPHPSGATVYVATPQLFAQGDKAGTCTATNEPILPVINAKNGRRWNCINSTWMVDNGVLELPPSACYSAVSGNATGTNGYTVAGSSNTPVIQAQTSVTGTNTHTYICTISIPSFLSLKGAAVTDVVFKYGIQGGAIGTQVATLSSGTMNSTTVFSYLDFPAPGASETASTVAPTRADAGSLLITPAVASFNTGTTTAGAFFTLKFTPASAIPVPVSGTDRRQLLFTVALLNTATTATTTNSPGLTVHYAYVPNEFMIGR